MRRLRKSGVRSGEDRGYCTELETSHEVKRCGLDEIRLCVRSENTGRRCFEQSE